jgi:hypothetical protein
MMSSSKIINGNSLETSLVNVQQRLGSALMIVPSTYYLTLIFHIKYINTFVKRV